MRGMRQTSFPTPKYLLPTAVSAGSKGIAVYAAEQALTPEPWWQSIPWEAIAILGLGWLLGTIYADLWNPTSRLREWLRWQLRFFDVVDLVPASTRELGYEEYRLTLRVRFRRKLRGDIILRPVKQGHYTTDSIMLYRSTMHRRGETLKIIVASIPEEPATQAIPQPIWGGRDNPNKPPQILEGMSSIVFFEAHGRLWRQSHKIFVTMFRRGAETGGRFYFSHEDIDIYEPRRGLDNGAR